MSKINLLTIHWGLSYGAIMQTYATCKLLEMCGHHVNVINIIHPRLRKFYTKLRSFLLLCMDCQFSLFKHRYFSHLTHKMYYLDLNKIPKADYTVIGSDQVWNNEITSPIDLTYFINFPTPTKKISLASSFGIETWAGDQQYTAKIKTLLEQFHAISTREVSGEKILNNVFNVKSTVLIDPTLAYGNFAQLAYNTRPINKIFPFFINKNPENDAIVEHISKDMQIPIFKHNKFSFYLKNSPRHWITRIRNSQLIITNSFHGVAMSIVFKKEFIVLCSNPRQFTRIDNLLQLLNLRARFVSSINDFESRKAEINKPINYLEIDKVLMRERANYIDFIGRNFQ